ncbi:hypothetical protein FJY63_05225, partial [Candidatus Sumerlaeota bacterium]|nr:hypothetical protein [Candidatus Sumerlaeota bacterium]
MIQQSQIKAIAGSTVLSVLSVLSALSLATNALAQTTPTKPSEMPKQLAIMTRILEKRLGDSLPDQVITASMLQRGIQGYYVPGVGALFFIDVKFAVAEPPVQKPAPEKKKPGDLWDRFEEEIEGRGPFVGPGPYSVATVDALGSHIQAIVADESAGEAYVKLVESVATLPPYDSAKVERLKSALFQVLAEYGRRVEGLADEERIVFIVSCKAGDGMGRADPRALSAYVNEALTRRLATPTTQRQTMTETSEQTKATSETRPKKGTGRSRRATTSSSRVNVPMTTFARVSQPAIQSVLIVSVARKDLVDDPKNLAKRAKIEACIY